MANGTSRQNSLPNLPGFLKQGRSLSCAGRLHALKKSPLLPTRCSLEERLLQQWQDAGASQQRNMTLPKKMIEHPEEEAVSQSIEDVPPWQPSQEYKAAEHFMHNAMKSHTPTYSPSKLHFNEASGVRSKYGRTLLLHAKQACKLDVAEEGDEESISTIQFTTSMEAIGLDGNVARNLFLSADRNHDGYLDKIEFLLLIERWLSIDKIKGVFQKGRPCATDVYNCDDAAMQDLLKIFRCWDRDGDGIVSITELTHVLSVLNPDIVLQSDVEKLQKEIDIGKDGKIDFSDWIVWLYAHADAKKTKAWLSGRDDRDGSKLAKLRAGVQRKRAEEARAQGKQKEYEEQQHRVLQSFFKKAGIRPGCNTLNHGPGARGSCKKCNGYHFWFCHYCGYINYWGSCVNGCDWGTYGWSCVSGKCAVEYHRKDHSASCGCKCTVEYLRKHGFAMDTSDMGFDIDEIHDASHLAQEAALIKKDVVAIVTVQRLEILSDRRLMLDLSKLNGDSFEVVVPAGIQLGKVAAEILSAGGYAKLLEVKLVMLDGGVLSEEDPLPTSA